MSLIRWRKVALVSMVLSLPSSAEAQSGTTLVGHFAWGSEVSSLRPCGSDVEYWLAMPGDLYDQLVTAYDRLTVGPYESVYVATAGWFDTGPTDGFAADYDGVWRLTRVEAVEVAGDQDCAGEAAPVWLQPEPPDCTSPRTRDIEDCLLVELMHADRSLEQYVTESYLLVPAGGSLYETQALWEAYREAQCVAAYENADGGSIRTVSLLSCRLEVSNLRARTVWSMYLSGTTTKLEPPP